VLASPTHRAKRTISILGNEKVLGGCYGVVTEELPGCSFACIPLARIIHDASWRNHRTASRDLRVEP